MQLAMAKLIVSLIKSNRLKGLKYLVKQGSNKGKSIDSMVKTAYKTLAGSKKSKF